MSDPSFRRAFDAVDNLYQDMLRLRETWDDIDHGTRSHELGLLLIDTKAAARRISRAQGDLAL